MELFEIEKILDLVKSYRDQGIKEQDILVVFDVDETLATTYAQEGDRRITLVTSKLWRFMAREIAKQGGLPAVFPAIDDKHNTHDEALNRVMLKADELLTQLQVRNIIRMQPVEATTTGVVTSLKEQNIRVIGLTGRPFPMHQTTNQHLLELGIHFHDQALSDQELVFDAQGFCGFARGIIYTKTTILDKGVALTTFLQQVGYVPRAIIMIDDFTVYIQDVQNCLEKQDNLQFTCCWYRYAESIPFDEVVAYGILKQHFGEQWWLLDQPYDTTVSQPTQNV